MAKFQMTTRFTSAKKRGAKSNGSAVSETGSVGSKKGSTGSRRGGGSTGSRRGGGSTGSKRGGGSTGSKRGSKTGSKRGSPASANSQQSKKPRGILEDSSNLAPDVTLRKRRNLQEPPDADTDDDSASETSLLCGEENNNDQDNGSESAEDEQQEEVDDGNQQDDQSEGEREGIAPGNIEIDEQADDSASALSSSRDSSNSQPKSVPADPLKGNSVMYERDLLKFVVHEVFKDMKFTEGDDEVERGLCQLAIDEEYVTLGDISPASFVRRYQNRIATNCTLLRQRAHDSAKRKFKNAFEKDLKETDALNVLPPNLGEVLTSPSYRRYHYRDGTLISERANDYKVFKWFVKNILHSINFELTSVLMEQASEIGYRDFISKVYSVSDEAFAILMVLNYEEKWRNLVLTPFENKKDLKTNPLYASKWTSSNKGFCKLPCGREGVVKYNKLVELIGKLRSIPQSGVELEEKVLEDFGNSSTSRKKKKNKKKRDEVYTRPVMGGALQPKLAALKKK